MKMSKNINIAVIGLGQIGSYVYNELNIKKKDITRYFEINSSRGCPYKCSFCLNSKEGIPYTKARSSRIIQEMVRLKEEYKIDGISFNDENFILNKKRIEEIAQAAIDMNLNLKMRGGGRVELFLKFDDRYLELFKKAGFYHFALGVESGSNKTPPKTAFSASMEVGCSNSFLIRQQSILPLEGV